VLGLLTIWTKKRRVQAYDFRGKSFWVGDISKFSLVSICGLPISLSPNTTPSERLILRIGRFGVRSDVFAPVGIILQSSLGRGYVRLFRFRGGGGFQGGGFCFLLSHSFLSFLGCLNGLRSLGSDNPNQFEVVNPVCGAL
jgi:hypothetical protein